MEGSAGTGLHTLGEDDEDEAEGVFDAHGGAFSADEAEGGVKLPKIGGSSKWLNVTTNIKNLYTSFYLT